MDHNDYDTLVESDEYRETLSAGTKKVLKAMRSSRR